MICRSRDIVYITLTTQERLPDTQINIDCQKHDRSGSWMRAAGFLKKKYCEKNEPDAHKCYAKID